MLVIGSHKPGGSKRCLTNTGVNISPMHTSHLLYSRLISRGNFFVDWIVKLFADMFLRIITKQA